MKRPATPANPLTRRRFLAVSATTAALLGGAGALALRGGAAHDAILASLPRPYAPVVLTRGELAVLVAAVDRLVGAEPPFPSARDVGVACRIDKELSFHGPRLQADVKAALFLVEHGGVARGSLARFTSLSPDAQDARLQDLADGVALERQVFVALRTLATFFYYVDERTWPHIGYAGPHVGRVPPAADSRT